MAHTKTYTKRGFNLKAVTSGTGVDRVADIYDNDVYVGRLYVTHGFRGDVFKYWTHKKFRTSEEGLFDAARTLIQYQGERA